MDDNTELLIWCIVICVIEIIWVIFMIYGFVHDIKEYRKIINKNKLPDENDVLLTNE